MELWRLEVSSQVASEMSRLLSPEESARAARFRFRRDREDFTVAHGALRMVLGKELGRAPESLRFRYGPSGKPELADEKTDLDFNLSHSVGMVLIALSHGGRIGVDVEFIDPLFNYDEVVQSFSAAEKQALNEVSGRVRRELFYRMWTRREALAKAMGEGLGADISELVPAGPVFVSDEWWTVADIRIKGPYAAAVVESGRKRYREVLPDMCEFAAVHQ